MGIEEKLPSGILLTTVEKLVNWARKSSIWGATFGLACCAIEMMAAGAPALRPGPLGHGGLPGLAPPGRPDDRGRPGEPEDGPGAAPDLRPDARAAVGALDGRLRLVSGGMFNNYAIVQGVDHIVPVDMYLPGCPPRPEMLIDAILKLREKIMHEPLGAERPQDARGPRGRAASVPVVAPGAMPSSYRSDKARRAEWEQAVREGREEQLRIENWMKLQPHLPGGCASEHRPRSRRRRAGHAPPVGATSAPRPSTRRPARRTGHVRHPRHRRHLRLRRPGPPAPGVAGHARGRTAATSTRSYDALEEAFPGFADAIEKVVVDRGELTLHIEPERIAEVCQVMRDDAALRFELCSSVSGVDYLGADERRLHVVYHLTSMTYRRRVRLEVAVTAERPHCRASPASTRPPTGRSGRPTTCSASSSTATPT